MTELSKHEKSGAHAGNRMTITELMNNACKSDTKKAFHFPYDTLGKGIVSKIPITFHNKNVLVVSDLGLLIAEVFLLRKNKISTDKLKFIGHTQDCVDFAISMGITAKLVPYNKLNLFFNGDKEYNYVTANGSIMEFDVVLGNPPYMAGKHLEFMKKCRKLLAPGGRLKFIHPADFIVQKREPTTPKRKIYQSLRNELASSNVDIQFIDNPFGAALFIPLSITSIENTSEEHLRLPTFEDSRTTTYGDNPFKSKNVKTVDSLHVISKWTENGVTEQTLLSKIRGHVPRWISHMQQQNGLHFVSVSGIAGGGYTTEKYSDGVIRCISNMFSLTNNTCMEVLNAPAKARTGKIKPWVSFNTCVEAQNALNFIARTKFIRAYLAIIKVDQHAGDSLMGEIPWLDWSQSWSDNQLNKFFGLSQNEIDLITEITDTITETM